MQTIEADDAPAIFTADELAKRWRVSPWSIYEAVRQERLPALRLGRRIRISRAAVEAFERGEQ